MNRSTLDQMIAYADEHRDADEYRSGYYRWDDGACAIGCTIRDVQRIGLMPASVNPGDHGALAAATGVPELAWRLLDHAFEILPERVTLPPRFLRAIQPDADYSSLASRIMARLACRLAEDALTDEVRACAEVNAALYERRARGDEPAGEEWRAACSQAEHVTNAHKREEWRAAASQPHVAVLQADAARNVEARMAWWQAYAALRQSDAECRSGGEQARVAWWRWCIAMVCDELSREEAQ